MSAKTPYVVVVAWDRQWSAHFELLRDEVWPLIEDVAIGIEHVGSTSVEGLSAKPVIDLDVIVPSAEALDVAIERLAEVGWAHRGELGIVGRHAFSRRSDLPTHNLYVCLEGTLGLRNHLLLRDHLRSHPEDVRTYSALKACLAEAFPDDIEAYVEGKTEFIVGILERYGLSDGDRREIVSANLAET